MILLVLNFAPIHLPISPLFSHEQDKFTRLNTVLHLTCPHPRVRGAPFRGTLRVLF